MFRIGPRRKGCRSVERREDDEVDLFWTRVWFGPLEPGWFNFFETASRRFAIFWPMVLMFSITGSAFMSLCVFGCWLLSGRFAKKWRTVANNPVAAVSLGIGLLSLAGCLYGTGNQTDLLKALQHKSNYFIAVMCITLFDKAFYRDAAIALFHLGAAVLLAIKIAMIVLYGNEYASMEIVDYVTFGIALVAWMLLIIYRPFSWKSLWPTKDSAAAIANAASKSGPAAAGDFSYRFELKSGIAARLILVLLLTVFLLAVNPGRTVYLCLMAVLGVVLIRNFQWKAIAKGSAVVLALLLISTACFPRFRERWVKAYREAVEFQADGKIVSSDNESSIGNRLYMYEYGLKIFTLHPVFGTGTGSVAAEYEKQIDEFNRGRESKWVWRVTDPHSEYLSMMIQYGIVGLIAWVAWLGTLWHYSARNRLALEPAGAVHGHDDCDQRPFFLSHVERPHRMLLCADVGALLLGGNPAPRKANRKTHEDFALGDDL